MSCGRKKLLGFIVSLVMICATLTGALAQGDMALFTNEDEGNYVQSMQRIGDTLYFMVGSKIFTWRVGDTEAVEYGAFPQSETNGSMGPQNDGGGVVFSVSGSGGGISLAPGGMGGDSPVNFLLAWDGRLMGLETTTGILYPIEVMDGVLSLGEGIALPWDSMMQDMGGFSFTRQINSPFILDGVLYMLRATDDYMTYQPIAIDLGTLALREYKGDGITAMVPYKDGKALLVQYEKMEDIYNPDATPDLSLLDFATGDIQKAMDLASSGGSGLAYDDETDTAYYISNGEIFAVEGLRDVRLAGYVPPTFLSMSQSAVVLPGNVYVFAGTDGGAHVRYVGKDKEVLTALKINNPQEYLYQAFAKKYADLPIVIRDGSFDSGEKLMQDMMGGGSDIYGLDISLINFKNLRDKGYATALSQSDVLKDAVSKMYPFIKDLVEKGGELFAFPVTLEGNLFGYNPEALKVLGITEEDLPKTIPQMLDFISRWEEDYGLDHANMSLFEGEGVTDPKEYFLAYIMEMYEAYYSGLGETLTYDTPLFKALLEALEVADLSGLQNDEARQAVNGVTFSTAAVTVIGSANEGPKSLFTWYQQMTINEYGAMGGYKPLELSLEEGMEPINPVTLRLYVVNPFTDNKDSAIRYLEYLAGEMEQSNKLNMMPEYNEPLKNPYYEDSMKELEKERKSLEAQLGEAKEEDKRAIEQSIKEIDQVMEWQKGMEFWVDAEAISAYRLLAEHAAVMQFSPLYGGDGGAELRSLITRFREGQMNAEQFIKGLEQKLRLMQMEGN